MKNISKTILGLLLSLSIYSCDDFLEVENPNTITEASFWQNSDDATKGLMAAYSALQMPYVMGGEMAVFFPGRSDTAYPNKWNSAARTLSDLSMNENTMQIVETWRQLYTGVLRTNHVIDNVPAIEMDEDRKELILAEARFLRGLFNYWIYSTYNQGSIPLHLTVPKTKEALSEKLSTKEEVFQVIVDDLVFAQQRLPETWTEDQLGRATWGAATAILGQVYINEHKYAEARDEFQKIVDRTDLYQLTPEISWNFDEEHEFNSESIFEVSFSTNQKKGSNPSLFDGTTGSEATRRNVLQAPSKVASGYRTFMPSFWMTNLFRSEEMNPDDSRNEGNVFSQRALASIVMYDDQTMYYQTESKKHKYTNSEVAYVRKYTNHEDPNVLTNGVGSSGINERVVRLADIQLLYAECLLKLEGDAAKERVLELINDIRNRSGVMPLLAADYEEAGAADKLMEHIMWVERPLELMFEGHDTRWVDLRRWEKIGEQYTRLSEIGYRYAGKIVRLPTQAEIDKNNDDDTTNDVMLFYQFKPAAAVYSPDTHDYFPIPAAEELSNISL